MAESPPKNDQDWQDDPVYRNSLREAKFIFGLWACCLVYTVLYCYAYGYLVHEPLPSSFGPAVANLLGPLESLNRAADSVTYPLGLGIPDWVFYGVLVPWIICIILTFWYGLFFFIEDDLSEGADTAENDWS